MHTTPKKLYSMLQKNIDGSVKLNRDYLRNLNEVSRSRIEDANTPSDFQTLSKQLPMRQTPLGKKNAL